MNPAIAPRVRTVLATPHGRRFSHTPTPSARRLTEPERAARHQAMAEQMRDNPRVARRLKHGELPAWMRTTPLHQRISHTHPQRRRQPAHRKHRRRFHVPDLVLDTIGYPLAVTAGALASHLGHLLGQLT